MRYFSHIIALFWFVLSGLPAQAQTKDDSLKQHFIDAQTELQMMLEGKAPMNFSRAVFLHENAYLGGTLSYEGFMQAIRFRAEIAKRIAHTKPTQGYKKADSPQVQLQASIFKLLTDSTQIKLGNEEGFILPARYAWEDFAGQKNWEVMFVSRLMQTNEGNCHSLPYLYKLIADELQVPAWLSCAPHHLYIQGYSQQTGLFNTELSSASFPKDSWLMASGYVGKDAVRNRVYMDTLTLKQSIALCMVDLAQGYQRKFQDKDFVLACLQTAQKAYPQGLTAYLAEIQTQTDIFQSTKQWANYHRLEALAKRVCELGYQEIPRAEYVRWLANPHHPKSIIEKQEEAQTESKFSTNPLPTFEVNTLSGGKYQETNDLTKPRRIGSLLYSTKQGKILQFVAPDTVAVPVEVSARFLSVDPLTKGYPMLTPYQFASNRPIDGIDVDGLEYLDYKEAKIRVDAKGRVVLNYSNLESSTQRKIDAINIPKNWNSGEMGIVLEVGRIERIAELSDKSNTALSNQIKRQLGMGLGRITQQNDKAENQRIERKLNRGQVQEGVYHNENNALNKPISKIGAGVGALIIIYDIVSSIVDGVIAATEQNKIAQQKELLSFAMRDLNEALEKGMIPEKYQDSYSQSVILNTILSGTADDFNRPESDRDANYQELQKIGMEIVKKISSKNDDVEVKYKGVKTITIKKEK
jgi:hypothetical protein